MSTCISNAISYLPPLALSQKAKDENEGAGSFFNPFGSNPDDSQKQNRNLSVLFALSTFLSGVTSHYVQRYYLTQSDLTIISKTCPTFCFFDTLRLYGRKIKNEDVRRAVSQLICPRTLDLKKTSCNDKLVADILKIGTLHEIKYEPNEIRPHFGGMRPAANPAAGGAVAAAANNTNNAATATTTTNNNNTNNPQPEEEKLPDMIMIPYLLKLFDHRQPKARSSVAMLFAEITKHRLYMTCPEQDEAVERLKKEKKALFEAEQEEKKKQMQLQPQDQPTSEDDATATSTSSIEKFNADKDAELALFKATEDDHAGGREIEAEKLYWVAIQRKLKQRFELETENETLCFMNYFYLAFTTNIDINRELMQTVRDKDFHYIYNQDKLRKELKEQETKLAFEVWNEEHIRLKEEAKKKKKDNNNNNNNSKSKNDDSNDNNNNNDATANEDAAAEDPSSSLIVPTPKQAALDDLRKRLSALESNFLIEDTSPDKQRIIEGTNWIFDHIEHCIKSSVEELRGIGFEVLKSCSDYFSITFFIAHHGHLLETAVERAFAPVLPKKFEQYSEAKQKEFIRTGAKEEMDDRYDKAVAARRKYIFDPHALKKVGQVIATTVHRHNLTFGSRSQQDNPLYQAVLMWVIRYVFKKLSYERLLSQIYEQDVEMFGGSSNKKKPSTTNNDDDTALAEGEQNNEEEDNFYAPFHLDAKTRCILADIMQMYTPYCIRDVIYSKWWYKVIVDLIKRESSPIILKTKAVELVRDSIGKDYPNFSVAEVVREFERHGLVDAIFAVFKQMDKNVDPVMWIEGQIFVCIATDCLSMMATVEIVPEIKRVNEVCIAMRDDVLGSSEHRAEVRTLIDRLTRGLEEDEAEKKKLIEEEQQQQQQNNNFGVAPPPPAGPNANNNNNNSVHNGTSDDPDYVFLHPHIKHILKHLRDNNTTCTIYRSSNIRTDHLLGRVNSNTLRLCQQVPDAVELLEKVRPLVYQELQERTFNPIYLPLKRAFERGNDKNYFASTPGRYFDTKSTYVQADEADDDDTKEEANSKKVSGKRRQREDDTNNKNNSTAAAKTKQKKTTTAKAKPVNKKATPVAAKKSTKPKKTSTSTTKKKTTSSKTAAAKKTQKKTAKKAPAAKKGGKKTPTSSKKTTTKSATTKKKVAAAPKRAAKKKVAPKKATTKKVATTRKVSKKK